MIATAQEFVHKCDSGWLVNLPTAKYVNVLCYEGPKPVRDVIHIVKIRTVLFAQVAKLS